ncbi:hypothetical protein LDENG_00046510 [Lucifuga dentata]|nr:hypothetical protein LDENG_00046510 [Lucifuga dentata]
MEQTIDVKALRAKFQSSTNACDSSSRESGSPKSPRPGNDLFQHKLTPTVPPPPAVSGPLKFPVPQRIEPMAASVPRPTLGVFPRPPPTLRSPTQDSDSNRVMQVGEKLQNMMLVNQRPLGTKPAFSPRALAPAPSRTPAPVSTPVQTRQLPRYRISGEVTPLRKPLPHEGPRPLKPKRPPIVNLEPYLRNSGRLPGTRKDDGSSGSGGSNMSSAGLFSPPRPPQRSNKPSRIPHQLASIDIEDDQETYDDIANVEKQESWSDDGLQCMDAGSDEVYEFIDEDHVEVNQVHSDKKTHREAKRQREQEKKDQKERQKRENELRKNFQLQGEVEVLHTAKVRHDWRGGGKLDLSVRQGESVEILRVKNNPGGKWLARSLTGNYGYISNTCVDIDYEEVKRKVLQSRKIDTSALPPPPPDPPQMFRMEFCSNTDSMIEEEDDYDDVQPTTEDFPLPPPDISLDPKVEKELRKKFKCDEPLRVLHTMMVDPNGVIKKPGSKHLPVAQGEILDIIQLTNNKKALCRNQYGKYGFVSRSLLLQMEGDIYDDVDYVVDVYDNDCLD